MYNRQNKPNDNEEDNKQGRPFLRRILIWLPLILILLVPLLLRNGDLFDSQTTIPYTEFREQVDEGNVAEVTVQGEEISGELVNPAQISDDNSGEETEYTTFTTFVPSFGDEQLLDTLRNQGVQVYTQPVNNFNFGLLLVNALPLLLLLGLGYFFLRNMRSQGQQVFQVGRSTAKKYDHSAERTTFDDVAGQEAAKRELEEVVEFLREPEKFQRLGGEIPKGVLLVGPPGTGKTLLARAAAGEAGVPFFSITGSDFMEMFVGVGASRVRDLFNEAKQVAPAIIFIDELDSIGRRRGAGLGGGHDEREQTLNQLLSELDGFEQGANVIAVAATNRPDILDPALMRAGRFDRQITVDLPTLRAREQILEIHAKGKPLGPDVDLSSVARGTPGFSGADLKNLLNESALLAARRDKRQIEADDIEEARDKILMGLAREGLSLSKRELELIAYHEAGHALIAAVMEHADPVHKVTIVPRGRAMGVTQQLPEQEKYIYERDYMLDRLAVMMGGRAAEDVVFNTATSGAANDFQQSTKLARQMVLQWGMSPRFENMALGEGQQNVFLGDQIASRREYSETTAREVDEEVKAILNEAYKRATTTLTERRSQLDAIADALLEEEIIDGERVLSITGQEVDHPV